MGSIGDLVKNVGNAGVNYYEGQVWRCCDDYPFFRVLFHSSCDDRQLQVT